MRRKKNYSCERITLVFAKVPLINTILMKKIYQVGKKGLLQLCCGCCPHSLVLKYEEFEEQNRYNHFQLFRDEHNLAIRILTQLILS